MSAAPADVPVVYIVGSGRSGSTLFDRLLGQATIVTAVGELTQIWWPGEVDRLVCGCGSPVKACAFWSEVAAVAYGGWDSPDFARVVLLRSRVARMRQLHRTVLPALFRRRRRELAEFRDLVKRTYAAIAKVGVADVVVDSSKEVAYAWALAGALGPRLRLVHLVRHSNGVAYSWTKAVAKPEIGNDSATLARFRPGRTAIRWLAYNLLSDLLRLQVAHGIRVRYEDFVADPDRELGRVHELAGLPRPAPIPRLADGRFFLEPTHTAAGNPNRFRSEHVLLVEDNGWRQNLPARNRVLVTVISAPLLARFGYLGARPSGRPSTAIKVSDDHA